MRLRYYLRYYPTLTETFVYNEVRALQRRGHALSALAIGSRADGALQRALPDWEVQYPPGYAVTASAAALTLSTPGGREAASWLARHQPKKWVARALWAASTLTEGEGIHVHFAGEAGEWARAARLARGAEYTVTVHAVDLFCPRPSLPEVLRDARAVLTISEHNAREIRDRYGVEARVVRCGVDPGAWLLASPGGDGPVVAVGRWVPKKGFDLLVEAVRATPGARLQLVGDAPPEIAGEGIEVLGPRSHTEIREILAGASLFALPCRVAEDGNRDGIPVAMMEAMAAGLPILTTTLPGIQELVDERCGWLAPPGDLPSLSDALRAALSDPVARAARGAAARARVLDGFTLDDQADGVLAAWGVTDASA